MKTKITTKADQQRKFLLMLPVLVVPFICLAFYALGGGRGAADDQAFKGAGMGFNMELPAAVFSKKEEKLDKLAFYKQADADSIRRKEWMQQDPYHRDGKGAAALKSNAPAKDTQGTALLERLAVLKKEMDRPVPVKEVKRKKVYQPVGFEDEREIRAVRRKVYQPERRVDENEMIPARGKVDTPEADPELERLSAMVDKLVQLKGMDDGGVAQAKVIPAAIKDDQARSAAAPAVVEGDQTLVNGGTIGLRLMATVVCNGVTVRKGQLVFGTVSLGGDRLQVGIHSIRVGSAIVATSWQVYDLDGLAGIRVPDGSGRQVARQTVDQGIGSLNLLRYDPSIGSQVAGVGIQAAKSFFGRRVRQVRVTVPAGYQVLLKDTKAAGPMMEVMPHTVRGDTVTAAFQPPDADSVVPFLHEKVRDGDVSLQLRGIYQRDQLCWLYLTLSNMGVLPFSPDYLQCSIETSRHVRRMAMQVVPVQPVYDSLPGLIGGNEVRSVMIGLRPLVVGKDKRLCVAVGEGASGRVLVLRISSKVVSKIR